MAKLRRVRMKSSVGFSFDDEGGDADVDELHGLVKLAFDSLRGIAEGWLSSVILATSTRHSTKSPSKVGCTVL